MADRKNRLVLSIVGLAAFSAAMLGCPAEDTESTRDCVANCEQVLACAGLDWESDCESSCTKKLEEAEVMACDDLWRDYEACLHSTDACLMLDCMDQLEVLDGCEQAYCASHPSDELCPGPS